VTLPFEQSDGIVAVKGGPEGTSMIPWEVVEHATEPTLRVVFPRTAGDLSDGTPQPCEVETSMKTTVVEILPAHARLQLFKQLGQQVHATCRGSRVQVVGMRGTSDRPSGDIGVIVLRVQGWSLFLDLLDCWLKNNFQELSRVVPEHTWGAALFMLRCFAFTAREWRGVRAPDGSMVIRLEEP
jgi:hypothetical protein